MQRYYFSGEYIEKITFLVYYIKRYNISKNKREERANGQ